MRVQPVLSPHALKCEVGMVGLEDRLVGEQWERLEYSPVDGLGDRLRNMPREEEVGKGCEGQVDKLSLARLR